MSWNHIRLLGAVAWGDTLYVRLYIRCLCLLLITLRMIFVTLTNKINTFLHV